MPASRERVVPLDLTPGDALGPFQLGSTLFNLLNLLQTYKNAYPSVHLAWDEEDPSTSPVHLSLYQPPLKLLFEPLSQRLCRIQVDSRPEKWISYRGKLLNGASSSSSSSSSSTTTTTTTATAPSSRDEVDDIVKTVRRVMGPTYSASVDTSSKGDEEILSYPGVAFGVSKTSDGGTRLSKAVITPLPSPPNVSVGFAWLHPVLPESPAVAHGDIRLARINLDESRKSSSVTLLFHGSTMSPIELKIGVTTSEDLLCSFGSPIRMFWKEDDRMSIHAIPSGSDPSLEPNPYFASYPHLALTFLLHPTTHRLLKIILHSNLPGEVNFGRTSRCSWELVSESGERCSNSSRFAQVSKFLRSSNESRTHLKVETSKGYSRMSDWSAEPHNKRERSADLLNGVDRAQAKNAKVVTEEPPMILDRSVDDGDHNVAGRTTEIHGFPGIACEVTQSGYVETVWLF